MQPTMRIDVRQDREPSVPRRTFLTAAATALAAARGSTACAAAEPGPSVARIAVTLDLEMSAQYPRRDQVEWNYDKGNLDQATKDYALRAGRLVAERGGKLHYFCVGRVLEQADVDWLKQIRDLGHPVGNHTYDHVNVKATKATEAQFRFQRAPWLVDGLSAEELVRQNIRITTEALRSRVGIEANGFRTPGGFHNGLDDSPAVQRLLQELKFRWVSSKYPAHPMGRPRERPTAEVLEGIVKAQRDAQPYVYPSGLIEVPMSPVSDVNAFRSNYWKLDWFLDALRAAVSWAIETGGVFDFLAHPSCLTVEDPQLESIRLICDLAAAAGPKARLVGLDEIAAATPRP